jgi:hypothetical protein
MVDTRTARLDEGIIGDQSRRSITRFRPTSSALSATARLADGLSYPSSTSRLQLPRDTKRFRTGDIYPNLFLSPANSGN